MQLILSLLFFVFFGIVNFFYWKMPFYFYFNDEWYVNNQYLNKGIKAIFLSNNEHFLPLGRFFSFLEMKIYGLNAIYLHYEAIIMHFIVVVLLIVFIYLLFRKKLLAVFGGVIFAFNPLLWESFFLQGGRVTMLNSALFLFSLILLLIFFENKKKKFFYLSLLFLVLQNFSFGFGIFLNFVYLSFFLLFGKKKDLKTVSIIVGVILILISSYVFLSPLKSVALNQADSIGTIEKVKKIGEYFYFASISNFVRPLIFFLTPFDFIVILKRIYVAFYVFSLFIFYAFINDRKNRKVIVWAIFYFLMFIVSISLSRYTWGPPQSLSSRYVYNYLPALVVLSCYLVDFCLSRLNFFRNKFRYDGFLLIMIAGFSFIYAFKYKILNFYKNHYSKMHFYNYSELRKKDLDFNYQADISRLSPEFNQYQLLDMFRKIRKNAYFKNYPKTPDDYPLVKKSQSLQLYPDNNNHIPGGINNSSTFYQTFVSKFNNLSGMEIFISTFGKKVATPYQLVIFDDFCEKELVKSNLRVNNIKDNEYFQIVFPKIKDSKEKKYCFTIKPNTENVITPITFQLSKKNIYKDGDLLLNGAYKEEDVVFSLFFD